jgi:hypothetical protein
MVTVPVRGVRSSLTAVCIAPDAALFVIGVPWKSSLGYPAGGTGMVFTASPPIKGLNVVADNGRKKKSLSPVTTSQPL